MKTGNGLGDLLHIGKSSSGWCFALHVYPEDGINDLDDWRTRWANGTIITEYSDAISSNQMDDIITQRAFHERWNNTSWYRGMYESEAHFHEVNWSERAPRGLLRCRLGGLSNCVKHGDGTWDCIAGYFS